MLFRSFDTSSGYVDVRVDWTIPQNICPNPFDTTRVYIHKYPIIDFTFNYGCEPLTTTFTSIEKRGINPSLLTYSWNINNSSFTSQGPIPFVFPTQGKYWASLTVINNAGIKKCGVILTKPVEVYPKPNIVFTTDPSYKTTIALPRFRTFNSTSVNQNPFMTTLKYNWSWGKTYKLGSDTSKSPIIIFGKDTGVYWIKLVTTTDKGCKDSLLTRVVIGPDIIIFVPDAFTPDNSGPNENNTFKPVILNNKTFWMGIYNRWGEKMYETTDLTKGWDGNYLGKPAQNGVYAYKIIVSSLEDKEFHYNGTVSLIR